MLTFTVIALVQAVATFNATAFAPFGIDRVEPNIPTISTATSPLSRPNTLLNFFSPPSDVLSETREWGDSIHSDLNDLHRIYFQNIDGMRNDADKMDLYTSCMAEFKMGTFCWANQSLKMSQVPIQQKLKVQLNGAHSGAA